MMDEIKPWRCKNGHVLGQVKRNGRGITQLWLYRESIRLNDEGGMAEVDVMAVVEGLVLDVRCSICGYVRTWAPGEEAIKRLVERYGRRGEVSADDADGRR